MARTITVSLFMAGLVTLFFALDTQGQNNRRDYNTEALFSPAVLPEPRQWNNGAGVLENDTLLKGLIEEHHLKDQLSTFLGVRYQPEPRFSVTDFVVGELRRARQEVRVAMYSMSSQELSNALIALHRTGNVKVRVVLDRTQATSKYNRSDKSDALREAGIEVRMIGDQDEGSHAPKMHHKFAVVDDETVLTGSFNWTVAADEANYENVLVLRNEHLTTAKFLAEFDWLWWYAEAQNQPAQPPRKER